MNELIPINYNSDRPTVSARNLHEFLEVETPFRLWFPRMTEYGFTESIDYTPYNFVHPQNHQETQDYQLTVAMAKEISMIQRNEKGKQARTYFIQVEEAWNTPESVMSRALKMADQRIHHLTAIVEQNKPKVLFADSVATAKTSILIGELAKIIKQNGVDLGEKRLFGWLRANGYLICRYGTDYNAPTQKSMDLKLFEVKETTINHSDGHVTVSKTTKVTGKGQQYFINKFLNSEEVK
jgi:anti-repressor protein